MIDDVDQLSKLENREYKFDFMLCNAGEITDRLIKDSASIIASAGFTVSFDCDMDVLHQYSIIADYDRIYQVLSNLVSNAIKYSTDDKTLTITFDIDKAKENYIVSVTDHGIGIKDEHIPFVFDTFYRENCTTDNSLPQVEGRGLGLTLCKEIVHSYNGEIYVKSACKRGSTFTFIIPLYNEED